VESMTAEWFQVTDRMSRRKQCFVVGCIMPIHVSNGQRGLCSQHLTPIAMEAPVVMRAIHDIPSHRDNGVCLFCGKQDWYESVGTYQCRYCYPQDFTPSTVTRSILPVQQFPPRDHDLAAIPTIHAEPLTVREQQRLARFSAELRAHRKQQSDPRHW
jgi:hypothetical protein